MAKREAFLLRIDPQILESLRKWADDEMRSTNGQIEYVLRQSLSEAGRLPKKEVQANPTTKSSKKQS